jgi:hypothetical protein
MMGSSVTLSLKHLPAYNDYLPGENPIKSYLTLTPFEMGYSDYNQLKALATTDDSQLNGPTGATSHATAPMHPDGTTG